MHDSVFIQLKYCVFLSLFLFDDNCQSKKKIKEGFMYLRLKSESSNNWFAVVVVFFLNKIIKDRLLFVGFVLFLLLGH